MHELRLEYHIASYKQQNHHKLGCRLNFKTRMINILHSNFKFNIKIIISSLSLTNWNI